MSTHRRFWLFGAGLVIGAALTMPLGASIRRAQFARIAELETAQAEYVAERDLVLRLSVATVGLAEKAEAFAPVCNAVVRMRTQPTRVVRAAYSGMGGD